MALDRFTQENILTLLTWSDDHFEIARSIVDESLFDPPYYHKVAEKIIGFIDRYNAPPKDHIADELVNELSSNDSSTYQSILTALFNSRDSFNTKYILEKLIDFVKHQRFENSLVEAFNLNRSGKKNEAYRKVEDALSFNVSIFDPGLRLSDLRAGLSSEETDESFPIRIPELDNRGLGPVRKQLWLLIAKKNGGKSMGLAHLGKMGLMSGSKVLHITLELSRGQIFKRYVQSILGLTKDRADSVIYSPKIEKDANGRLTDFASEVIFPQSLQDDGIYNFVEERWKYIGPRLDNLIISEFATNDLSIRGLNGHLDLLEKRENFIPDEILIDYANLMNFDKENYRIELGQLIQDLRGIAVKRNVAIATAAQLNRAGMMAKRPGIWHAAEDISQVATADTVCVYAQTKQELKYKHARLTVTSRNAKSQFTIILAQNYDICNWCLDSVMMPNKYKINSDEEEEKIEKGELLQTDD